MLLTTAQNSFISGSAEAQREDLAVHGGDESGASHRSKTKALLQFNPRLHN